MSVLTSEAVNVAAFLKERWEPVVDPVTKAVTLAGLKQAQKKNEKGIALKKSLESDILSLQKATQEAQVLFLLQSRGGRGNGQKAERGVFVLSEIKNSLEWLFDDGVTNENDEALASVEAEHADDGDNLDDLAQALDDFGALAAAHRDELAELGTFDVALIDEAPRLASDLRQPDQRGGDKDALRAAVEARLLRDRLATLLQQRMGKVRAAARHVFRHHPRILREVTSSCQRARRAAARRKQAAPTGWRPGPRGVALCYCCWAMGKPDQLGKEIFAEETPLATGGAFAFEVPPELAVFEVRLDGLLLVRDPARLPTLPAPWSLAPATAPVLLDLKMQRDHLDLAAVELMIHRRQSWQAAQLRKDGDYTSQPAAWVIASNVPEWAATPASPWRWERVAEGCYALRPSWFPLLWIASNELPLHGALVPFLVTRRGRPLVEFYRWALAVRPVAWVMRMLQYVPMTQAQQDEFLRSFPPTDDPELLENQKQAEAFMRALMKRLVNVRDEAFEEARQEGLDEGKKFGLDEGKKLGLDEGKKLGLDEGKKLGLDEGKKLGLDEGKVEEARKAVGRVLARRGLELSAEHQARLAGCGELATLERWLDQAVTAQSADEALR